MPTDQTTGPCFVDSEPLAGLLFIFGYPVPECFEPSPCSKLKNHVIPSLEIT